jgi:putative ABC transport system permease protein
MKLRRGLRLSARALAAHRVRAALAMASVAIGVAAVLVTSALGQGVRDGVLRDVAAMGTSLLVVRPGQVDPRVGRPTIRGRVTSLRPDDCTAIEALASVREAAPGAERRVRVKAGRGSMEALALGTSASFSTLRGLTFREGRFLEPYEDTKALRVAVLGARVASTLFPGGQAIGATIRIDGSPFEVVGVLGARGVLLDGSDEDGNVFVPNRTALRRLFNTTWLSSIFVSVDRPDRMEQAEEEIRRLLRDRHQRDTGQADDFDIQSQAKLLAGREALADSLTLLAVSLAGASSLVGGTGVLALMLLSVKERTGEIGLRLAVGARPADVFLQFLAEASLLALGGWLLGAVSGALVSYGIAVATDWQVGVPLSGLVATLATTGVMGIGFGAWPARRAARLYPIRALQAVP